MDSRVVLMTGASQGIGLATARRLVAAGHRVVMTSRNPALLNEAAATCHGPTPPLALPMDVRDEAAVARVVEQAAQHFGPVQALVNNAGIGLAGLVADLPVALFREVMEVNYLGVLTVTKACLPQLQQTRGVIVNVSSVVGYRALPRMGGYCATKFALVGLGESLRTELAPFGVAVVDVAPGRTDTPFRHNQLGDGLNQPLSKLLKNNGVGADTVAAAIERAIARRGPARVLLTPQGKLIGLLQRLSPALVDALVGVMWRRMAG